VRGFLAGFWLSAASDQILERTRQSVRLFSLLHFFTFSLLHFFTFSLLHLFTFSLLNFFTSSLFHFFTFSR